MTPYLFMIKLGGRELFLNQQLRQKLCFLCIKSEVLVLYSVEIMPMAQLRINALTSVDDAIGF